MEGRSGRDGNETSNEFYWEVRFLECIILAPHKAGFTGINHGWDFTGHFEECYKKLILFTGGMWFKMLFTLSYIVSSRTLSRETSFWS